MKHAPTPWHVTRDEYGRLMTLAHSHDRTIIRPTIEVDSKTGLLQLMLTSCNYDSDYLGADDRDIEFLLHAVNCHDGLVECCELLLGREIEVIGSAGSPFCVDGALVRQAEAILAKAKEGTDEVSPQADRS